MFVTCLGCVWVLCGLFTVQCLYVVSVCRCFWLLFVVGVLIVVV